MPYETEFEALKEIIYSFELKISQETNLKEVSEIFSSDEENKQEYTRVHNK